MWLKSVCCSLSPGTDMWLHFTISVLVIFGLVENGFAVPADSPLLKDVPCEQPTVALHRVLAALLGVTRTEYESSGDNLYSCACNVRHGISLTLRVHSLNLFCHVCNNAFRVVMYPFCVSMNEVTGTKYESSGDNLYSCALNVRHGISLTLRVHSLNLLCHVCMKGKRQWVEKFQKK